MLSSNLERAWEWIAVTILLSLLGPLLGVILEGISSTLFWIGKLSIYLVTLGFISIDESSQFQNIVSQVVGFVVIGSLLSGAFFRFFEG